MATDENVKLMTMEAGSDLSAKQFRFVLMAADGQVDVVASAGGNATGVLYNKPDAAGQPAAVAVSGRVKVVSAGTIDEGEKVQSDGSGEALVAASGDHVLGQAMTSAVDGDIFEVLLENNGHVIP